MAEVTPLHIYEGRWAVCTMGKIGKIESAVQVPNGVSCKGVSLDPRKKGSDRWGAHNPRLLHKSLNDLFDKLHAQYKADKQL